MRKLTAVIRAQSRTIAMATELPTNDTDFFHHAGALLNKGVRLPLSSVPSPGQLSSAGHFGGMAAQNLRCFWCCCKPGNGWSLGSESLVGVVLINGWTRTRLFLHVVSLNPGLAGSALAREFVISYVISVVTPLRQIPRGHWPP